VTRTILIVDDEAHLRTLIQQALEDLEDEGVELLTAANGEEAMAAIESAHPNLVFLDVMMPKLSGFDVCSRTKHDLGLKDVYIVLRRPRARSSIGRRARGRRRPLHDQAVRSGRAAAEGARCPWTLKACPGPPGLALRHVLGRQQDARALVTAVAAALGSTVGIEGTDGRLLHGEPQDALAARFPITHQESSLGWVTGSAHAHTVALLLDHLVAGEVERKALGAEVLHLYREVNRLRLLRAAGRPARSGRWRGPRSAGAPDD
jgi:CheY-like chemotaxis protein